MGNLRTKHPVLSMGKGCEFASQKKDQQSMFVKDIAQQPNTIGLHVESEHTVNSSSESDSVDFSVLFACATLKDDISAS